MDTIEVSGDEGPRPQIWTDDEKLMICAQTRVVDEASPGCPGSDVYTNPGCAIRGSRRLVRMRCWLNFCRSRSSWPMGTGCGSPPAAIPKHLPVWRPERLHVRHGLARGGFVSPSAKSLMTQAQLRMPLGGSGRRDDGGPSTR